jgi:hypothetical protein
LGGYPSPNLEVIAELSRNDANRPAGAAEALKRVAERQFGKSLAPAIVQAWGTWSKAFSEFPYHGGVVYNAPLQMGPANQLWAAPTGYAATMVGIPYDNLESWRAVYPPLVFIQQLEKVSHGFFLGIEDLRKAAALTRSTAREQRRLEQELNVAEAAALHFDSAAKQSKFILMRQLLAKAKTAPEAIEPLKTLEEILHLEIENAKRLHQIQSRDSRIGFEATNHYYYVPLDLLEKIVNCRDLVDHWLAAERKKWNA